MAFANGEFLRVRQTQEIFLIWDGRRIYVPTIDALNIMGSLPGPVPMPPVVIDVDEQDVLSFSRYDMQSGSPTPGSVVYPPDNDGRFFWHDVAGSVPLSSHGRELRLIELRGWLWGPLSCSGNENDWHYQLEVDAEWALQQGIDLHSLYSVGNLLEGATWSQGPVDAIAAVPTVVVELNSWGWGGSYPPYNQKPADWTTKVQCDQNADVYWPFDPMAPGQGQQLQPRGPEEGRGPYVRMCGSIVLDQPHITDAAVGFAEDRWGPGQSRQKGDPARHTEIHPPDLIEVLSQANGGRDTTEGELVWGVALVTGRGLNSDRKSVEARLTPPGPRPNGSRAVAIELVGPESDLSTVAEGNANFTGAALTGTGGGVIVRVAVSTGGLWRRRGKFKALYRLRWEPRVGPIAVMQPAVARLSDGRLQLWVVDRANSLFTTWKTSGSESWWTEWSNFLDDVGQLPSSAQQVAAAPLADGRLQFWAVDAAGGLSTTWKSGGPNSLWSGWSDFLAEVGPLEFGVSQVAAGRLADGRVQVWALQGEIRGVFTTWKTGGPNSPWSGWSDFLAEVGPLQFAVSKMALASLADGRLHLWVVDQNYGLSSTWKTGGANSVWSGWSDFLAEVGPLQHGVSQVAVAPLADGRLQLWAVDPAGALWSTWKTGGPNSVWSGWSDFLAEVGPLQHGVSQVAVAPLADGRLQVWAVDSAGGLWSTWKTGGPNSLWTPWSDFSAEP